MASAIFDTHAFKRLTAAGMPEQQAEILATIRLGVMLAGGIAIVAALVRLL